MPKKRWTHRRNCEHPGCKEWAFWEFDTRSELIEEQKRGRGWLCVRHRDPDELISAGNPLVEKEFEVALDRQYGKYPIFRSADGKESSGFIHGEGFRAFAEDLPLGSRIRITVRFSEGGGDA